MPVRFLLDFLRVSDVRYAGLTPAQWAALCVLTALPFLLHRARTAAGYHPPANADLNPRDLVEGSGGKRP